MSSLIRSTANLPQGNKYFTNVVAVTSGTGATADVYDATGAQVALVGRAAWAGEPAGTVFVRDMGKTVRIASQGASSHAAGVPVSMVLRKVQIVDEGVITAMGAVNQPLTSFIGLNEGVNGNTDNNFGTIYIQLSPATSWASVSL